MLPTLWVVRCHIGNGSGECVSVKMISKLPGLPAPIAKRASPHQKRLVNTAPRVRSEEQRKVSRCARMSFLTSEAAGSPANLPLLRGHGESCGVAGQSCKSKVLVVLMSVGPSALPQLVVVLLLQLRALTRFSRGFCVFPCTRPQLWTMSNKVL